MRGDVVVDPNPELKRELIRQKEELEAMSAHANAKLLKQKLEKKTNPNRAAVMSFCFFL